MDEDAGILPFDIRDWSSSHLQAWISDQAVFKEEEVLKLKEAEFSGSTLEMVDRNVLKDIGIKSVGRQLEIIQAFKPLIQMHAKSQTKQQPISKWKRKIKKTDQSSWSEANKNVYRSKISVIRREATKIWPGNKKVYFKQNPTNTLKLEELSEKLTETCSVEDIGFGREAIRSHILQWTQEKNRRLSDGYDFEAEHTRAKRARKSPLNSSTDSSEGGDTEGVETSELEEVQVEHDIDKMSKVSAKVVLMVSFNVNSFDYLSVKGNIHPVAKHLKVKIRGMGKNEMAVPVAKELLRKGYVVPKKHTQRLNYNCIKRCEIKSEKDITFLFVKGDPASSSGTQSSTCVPTVSECNRVSNISILSSQSKSTSSVDEQSDDTEDIDGISESEHMGCD